MLDKLISICLNVLFWVKNIQFMFFLENWLRANGLRGENGLRRENGLRTRLGFKQNCRKAGSAWAQRSSLGCIILCQNSNIRTEIWKIKLNGVFNFISILAIAFRTMIGKPRLLVSPSWNMKLPSPGSEPKPRAQACPTLFPTTFNLVWCTIDLIKRYSSSHQPTLRTFASFD